MTRVFALTNHKGGVGKSTSATNIAFGMVGLLRRAGAPNNRVLLIDTDSHWYLATIEDRATRQIMAHRIGKHHDSHLVLSTIQQALATGVKPSIFHSDQGNEFMADRCTHYLWQQAIQISVSDVASP